VSSLTNDKADMSNIKVKSNLMVLSRITNRDWSVFAPADLLIKLFPEFSDSRTDRFLTQQQREQKTKRMFVAKEIVDVD
jgi:hypothetical protein